MTFDAFDWNVSSSEEEDTEEDIEQREIEDRAEVLWTISYS